MFNINIGDIFRNPMFMSAVFSWACAQVIKTIIHAIMNKKLDFERLFGDGGMPSGHSATVTALATSAALLYGFASSEFAISCILAIVVMHDAMGVRREAGKHAQALNELLLRLNDGQIPVETKLKEFLGHTPSQVFFGALLGLCVATVFVTFIL